MACYHFRLKTDKKTNGAAIPAALHVAYINRIGRYENVDCSLKTKGGTINYPRTISGKNPILVLPEKALLIYDSPFGKITLSNSGVHITAQASYETRAIALMTAQKIFGDELTISDQSDLKRDALELARDLQTGIHFEDLRLEQQREKLETGGFGAKHSGRGKQSEGDRIRRRSINGNGNTSRIQSNTSFCTIKDLAERNLHLHVLPTSKVAPKRKRAALPLSHDTEHRLHIGRERRNTNLLLRWQQVEKIKSKADKTANHILGNLQRSIAGDFAFSHLQYINREAAFAIRGGCKKTGHHLPEWAKDSAEKFFHAADRFERANGERYKEIVFSLPKELTTDQQKEILDTFIDHHLKDYYYAWAIHEKVGSLSGGEAHPHVHIMFSPREMDLLEKTSARPPELFFHRANKKHPERGGCAKGSKWNGKDRKAYLMELREDYARIQNEVLEKYHIPIRVSHLSLAAQKKQAELEGNFVLAEILNRVPERSLHPNSIVRNDSIVKEQLRLRKVNQKKMERIIQRELAKDMELQRYLSGTHDNAEEEYRRIHAKNLEELSPDEQKVMHKELEKIESLRRETEISSARIIWGEEAQAEAYKAFLSPEGRELYDALLSLTKDIQEKEELQASLWLGENRTEEEEDALTDLEIAFEEQLRNLRDDLNGVYEKIEPHLKNLERPSTRKDIGKFIQQQLWENRFLKKDYESKVQEYLKSITSYERKLEDLRTEKKFPDSREAFKQDVTITLERVHRLLTLAKKWKLDEVQQKAQELKEAQKDVLSYARVMKIAENIFENGRCKRLRERERALKKREAAFSSETQKLHSEEQKISLLEMRAALDQEAISIQKEWRGIEERRSTPTAEKKIGQIALGILKKNYPAVQKVHILTEELETLTDELADAKVRVDESNMAMKQEGKNKHYTTAASAGGDTQTKMQQARNIADSLLHPKYAALVAKEQKNRMDENWNLLSKLEQDELLEEESDSMGR